MLVEFLLFFSLKIVFPLLSVKHLYNVKNKNVYFTENHIYYS